MPKKLSSISLFYPAHNEEASITTAVEQALSILPKCADKFEIIIVNDGSTDDTKKIAGRLAKEHFQVRLVSQKNRGYGGALKRGFKESKLDWIFFTDGDLQFDLNELKKFVNAAQKHDLIFGYRKNRAEGMRRHILAIGFKVWNQVLLGFQSEIKDIDCAFKLMKRDAVESVEPFFSDGAMISTEMILKFCQAGYSFKQIGVNHYDRKHGNSSGSSLKVIFKAVQDTIVLRSKLLKKN